MKICNTLRILEIFETQKQFYKPAKNFGVKERINDDSYNNFISNSSSSNNNNFKKITFKIICTS